MEFQELLGGGFGIIAVDFGEEKAGAGVRDGSFIIFGVGGKNQ